jgi:hypothetical protein
VKPAGERLPPGSWERDEAAVAWIYGSILVGAAIVVAANVVASRSGQVALYTASTMLVVWLAHSYAAFVGRGGRLDIEGVRARILHALGTELPVLTSATPSVIATAVCAALGADVAATGLVGLITAIGTMAVVAAAAARRARAGRLGIAAAAASALVLGALLVAAKVALK